MLKQLEDLLPQVADLLSAPKEWDSLVINRRKPHTYRIFHQFGDLRVCLHHFNPCEEKDAFPHPHPWPGAFLMLDGEYVHRIGYSESLDSDPAFIFTEIVRPYSMYEITNKQTWHSVQPLKRTWTIMVNGAPWDEQHSQTRTTKGKDLEKMSDEMLTGHLWTFDMLLRHYLERR